jgi:hypothetical protein
MPEYAVCSYPGLQIRAASLSFSRGVTPSIATVLSLPFDNLNLPPSLLRFDFGNVSVQFPDSAVLAAFVRPRYMKKGWLFSVQIADRRWRWAYGSISGEHNRRKPDGTTDPNDRQTPGQLMARCLDALGESGYDLSRVPEGVFPYVNWQNINPALALASLCEYVACEVVLNHLTNHVEIWPLGTGPGTQTGFGELHQKFRYTPKSVPSSIRVISGDLVFQNKLRLRAVITDFTGVQEVIANSSIAPATGWGTQALHFPGVSATNQPLALDQAWRNYRITGQANSALAVPQCNQTITSTNQYLLNDYLLSPVEDDLSGFSRQLPYEIGGDYWPYSDLPTNVTNTYWLGQSTLSTDRRLVKFAQPVIGLSSSGAIQEPTLYLVTSYRVMDINGQLVKLFFNGNVGGSGGVLTLNRPEVFASYRSTYNGANETGTSNTQAEALQELERYAQIFQQKYASAQVSELTYPGIIAGNLNGVVAQARWSCGVNREALTYVCENDELDVTATPKTERRRREVLEQIRQAVKL